MGQILKSEPVLFNKRITDPTNLIQIHAALISDPSLSTSDRAAVAAAILTSASPFSTPATPSPPRSTTLSAAAHLNSGIALLDSCNTVAAHIDRLICRHLLLRFALHLLSSPSLSSNSLRRAYEAIVKQDRSPTHAINNSAGELAVPGGGKKADLAGIKISGKFPWVETFNKVSAAISGDLEKGFAEEVKAVEASIGRLLGERRWRR